MGFRYGEAEALKQYFIFSMNSIFQFSLDEMLASLTKKGPQKNWDQKTQQENKETESEDDIVW